MRGSFQSLAQVSNLRGTAEKGHEQHPILFKKLLVSTSSQKTVVLCWNVWSILNESKLQNFLNIIEDANVGLACVCETWFDSKDGKFTKMIRDYGYEPYHAFREGKRGGGVAVLYKKQLAVKEEGASTSEFSSLEYAWVTVSLQLRRKMVLACIYRKQEVSFSLFIDELSTLLDKIIFKGDAALIVGDFNAWVDIEDDVNANSLLTLMSAFGLSQQVQEPTHRNGHTLDQIYVNECQALIQHEVINDTLGLTTDHLPIMVKIFPHAIPSKKLGLSITENLKTSIW